MPALVILIMVANRYKTISNSAAGIAILLGLFGWMGLSRLVRAQFLALREQEFVEAAHAMGASNYRIIFRHLIPNSLGSSILVFGTLFGGRGDRRRDVADLPRVRRRTAGHLAGPARSRVAWTRPRPVRGCSTTPGS